MSRYLLNMFYVKNLSDCWETENDSKLWALHYQDFKL